MVPTMILFGLVLGRWWKSAIVAGAVVWAAVLLFAGIIAADDVLSAAVLGAANTAAGVAVHRVALSLVRWVRHGRSAPISS